jgi:DDE superfamily endonuclease
MEAIPSAARPLLMELACAFTRPTFPRWLMLLIAAILTTGRRTILNLLRTVGPLAPGQPSSYHRVFSRRCGSTWKLARILAAFILAHWVPQGPVYLAGDDTVDEHPGRNVFGKARHRDPVRSTRTFTAYRWGHKWVVLAILVRFPVATRPWALPVLVALSRSKAWNLAHRRRHQTPPDLLRQLLAVLIHWVPGRPCIVAGDGGDGTHELARFAYRPRRHLTLVRRFDPDANL